MHEDFYVLFEPPIDGLEVDRHQFPEFLGRRVGITLAGSGEHLPRGMEVIPLRAVEVAALARCIAGLSKLALQVFGPEEPGGPVRDLPDEGERACVDDDLSVDEGSDPLVARDHARHTAGRLLGWGEGRGLGCAHGRISSNVTVG